MAVKLALQIPNGSIDPLNFIDTLMEKIAPFEEPLDSISEEEASGSGSKEHSSQDTTKVKVHLLKGQPTYTSCLQIIKAFQQRETPPTADEVQQTLGHGVLAGK